MFPIKEKNIDNKIVKIYKSGNYISKNTNKLFLLDVINSTYSFSKLWYCLKYKTLNHSVILKIIKSINQLNEKDKLVILLTISFYDSTDHLIDYLNLFNITPDNNSNLIKQKGSITIKFPYYSRNLGNTYYKMNDIN